MDFEGCTTIREDRKIVVEEKRSKFVLANPHRRTVSQVKVDNCLIKDDRKRCDYLFEIPEPPALALYLELKGSDFKKAVEQLEATLGYLKTRHANVEKRCHVVLATVPKARGGIQREKKRFLSRTRVPLIVTRSNVPVTV